MNGNRDVLREEVHKIQRFFGAALLQHMSGSGSSRTGEQHDLTLADITTRLWAGKWIVVTLGLLFAAAAAVAMHYMTPRYAVHMLIAPVISSNERGNALFSRNPALLGLTADLDLGIAQGDSVARFERFIQLLSSVALAERLAGDPEIMHELFAGLWDKETGRWREPDGTLARARRIYRQFFGFPDWQPPTALNLAARLKNSVVVTPVPRTRFRMIDFTDTDPVFGRHLLQRIYDAAEGILRSQAAERAREQINYLDERLSTGVTFAENRQTFIALRLEAEKMLVLTQGHASFAADMLDPPHASAGPTFPRPRLFLLIAFATGAAIGMIRSIAIDTGGRRIRHRTVVEPVLGGAE